MDYRLRGNQSSFKYRIFKYKAVRILSSISFVIESFDLLLIFKYASFDIIDLKKVLKVIG